MFKPRTRDTLLIDDATIIFRNFAGKEGKYNREGDRNFCVLLEDHIARMLEADGWNVKFLKAREEGDTPQPYLPVSVSYRKIPPRIAMVTHRGKTILEEEMLDLLDFVEIERVDVNINPYPWALPSGSSGVKAYLKTLYLHVREDPLDLRYADIPEIDGRSPRLEIEAQEAPVSRQYDFDGEIVDVPQRAIGR